VSLLAMRMQGSQQMTSRRPDRPRSVLGRWLSVALAAGACAIGVLVGRSIAYAKSVGGIGGAFEAAFLSFLLIVAVVVLVLIALIALKVRHGHISQPIATILAAAGLLATGAFGGHTTAAAFGGLYREPVALEAAGQTTIDLQAGDIPFAARVASKASCTSVPDGRAVASITALELGDLGSGGLRATVHLADEVSNGATAEFWIDGADLPEGSPQVSWNGPVRVTEIGSDGATGKLIFTSLEGFSSDPALKGRESPAAGAGAPGAGWPATISGVMGWTCEAW
jgi:hypothetical protein